jgi:hypothetical protein
MYHPSQNLVARKLLKQLTLVTALLCGLVGAAMAQEAAGPSVIGAVTFQTGKTQLERNGVALQLDKDQPLLVGDRLVTGSDGYIHARMVDHGFISVRPDSRLLIQTYTYTPKNPSTNRVGILLENGVARTISGKAGETNREHYRFNTPVAAIGLRGTDYVVHAQPDITRVSVLKGAVTLSAFGPNCQAGSLAPCVGPLARELAAGSPSTYMEVRAQGGLPIIVIPENGNKDAPNRVAPPHSEERNGLGERQPTSAVTADVLSAVGAVAQAKPEPIPAIVWGRWSSVALPNIPLVGDFVTNDRETTFGNALFSLFRPTATPQLPVTGIVAMNYAQGDVYLQSTLVGPSQALAAATVSNAQLQLDFNSRQFTTSLNAATQAKVYALQAQGDIQWQGLLYGDPSRSNMAVAGVLTNNAAEAGYLFEANVAPGQTLVGATRWRR